MSISIKKDAWHVKDGNGQYRGTAIFSSTLPSEAQQIVTESIAEINAVKATIPQDYTELVDEVDDLSGDVTQLSNAIDQLEGQVVTDVTVTGTIVTITAEANKRYLCGTVASIDVTPCVSGAFDLIFTSGSTAAVLTIPNTVKWQDSSFDPSALDADTTYEISVAEGTLGLVAKWT